MKTKSKWLVLAGLVVVIGLVAAFGLNRGSQVQHFTAKVERGDHADRSQCRLDSASTTSPERSEDMHPSRPCLYLLCPRLALLLSLMLIAGLASCGRASSYNAPVLESRANVAG